jgi:hypothetical protein
MQDPADKLSLSDRTKGNSHSPMSDNATAGSSYVANFWHYNSNTHCIVFVLRGHKLLRESTSNNSGVRAHAYAARLAEHTSPLQQRTTSAALPCGEGDLQLRSCQSANMIGVNNNVARKGPSKLARAQSRRWLRFARYLSCQEDACSDT